MTTTIKNRRGTAAQWATANPILADGEIGFERDTDRFKIGNGSSNFTDLPYFVDETLLDMKASLLPPTGSFIYDDSGNLIGSTDGLALTYDEQGRVSTISDGITLRTLNYMGASTTPASVS